ncbi:DNA repair protein RecN (Recombination protein N) [Allochromatium warmingii]|uniref:DNA repair protein RecN n=1 Tax=Allochromatium warmingii TaxID=61595 RepID=A0A1H3EI32_ALLWA|nr:DNA repair protein RecN [Allochromatium warmingii]SDX77868.1 DNA repair protein RecN (Recombination protein N) [Allochromatium warmingii]
MLTYLQVRDLAIVSHLELECRSGMTALTGETGAGKSILIDALGLVLGDKADASLIRAGRDRAEILAEIDLNAATDARDWLLEQGLEDEGACVVRRLLVREGRSRAFINGRAVTTAQVRELGERLVDIHGQHAHQSLLRPASQRELLDAYGGHSEQVTAVATAFRTFRDLDQRLTALEAASADRATRLDLLRFQVEELSALGLSVAAIEGLDHEQRRLSHLGHLQETVGRVLVRLAEGEAAIADQLRRATREIEELTAIDAALSESRELLETATIHAGEAAAGLRRYLDGLDLDPAALQEVELRVGQLHDLARKYRVKPTELPDLLDQRCAELAALEQSDVTLGDLREQRERMWRTYLTAAAELSRARQQAAAHLTETVTRSMQQLGMNGGQFSIQLDPLPEERATASGLERVEMLVSANPGQPLQPLAKVASGGELSRISLAIQVATAECGRVPTLVFDEVDVGIGGGVAEIVGRLLRQLGSSRQVLCVTHLPQVAAQAHYQLRVRKETLDGQTFTRLEPLDERARVDEIARMLGGTEITARTRDHASEMLDWRH